MYQINSMWHSIFWNKIVMKPIKEESMKSESIVLAKVSLCNERLSASQNGIENTWWQHNKVRRRMS